MELLHDSHEPEPKESIGEKGVFELEKKYLHALRELLDPDHNGIDYVGWHHNDAETTSGAYRITSGGGADFLGPLVLARKNGQEIRHNTLTRGSDFIDKNGIFAHLYKGTVTDKSHSRNPDIERRAINLLQEFSNDLSNILPKTEKPQSHVKALIKSLHDRLDWIPGYRFGQRRK